MILIRSRTPIDGTYRKFGKASEPTLKDVEK